MTRVDFYVSQAMDRPSRFELVCRLLERAIKRKHHVVIALDHEDDAKELANALETYRPELYLPYRYSNEPDQKEPIVLDGENLCKDQHDLLICLTAQLPENFSQYQRFIEVVIQEESVLNYTRAHWSFFKERGYPVHHHQL